MRLHQGVHFFRISSDSNPLIMDILDRFLGWELVSLNQHTTRRLKPTISSGFFFQFFNHFSIPDGTLQRHFNFILLQEELL